MLSPLIEALERIRYWLEQNLPESAAALEPGLSISEIEALLSAFPFQLPAEIYTLYQWRNGSSSQDYNFFPFHWFLPLDVALSFIEEEKQIQAQLTNHSEASWNDCWFPFSRFQGDYYIIKGSENCQAFSPVYLVFQEDREVDDPWMVYSSLTTMMLSLAEGYETGAYYLDENKIINTDESAIDKIERKYNPEIDNYLDDD
ncbi:SMI1/KNR4 family protein [Crocosphaera sp. UHCC 0190]|uniref:SMI1/KNR4 family protein n=1 Tax=Crocosphaera sp. UHCC 0190 TaxID=3110246 RepID=UPI002B1FD457|nr:SMI1/KNR4 family protein [Crocosphaera sp. UHCC 0190]MEA5508929.1 SMI1/KNR4 family protein [Crocosphaera sp. UHCC 0190]